MQRSWLNVPHVTQRDEVNISDLEDFRKLIKDEAANDGVKVTPIAFIMKACAIALAHHPKLASSLSADGTSIIYKDYINIGMAVDTPAGLVVPVIKDANKKSIYQLAIDIVELATKAKQRKLMPIDMQGGCFTISSLGNIGGSGFTPIVNAPEVAILGVSRVAVKPLWNGTDFVPAKMLPLSLSYDHRVINGSDGGRFMEELNALLGDVRRLAL
jgi:pyruvate dehydrogenase E2 component (dihydrolipoamide acetyltransferase)